MRHIRYTYECDRCGAEIVVYGVVLSGFELQNGEPAERGVPRHLCPGCGDTLVDWINAYKAREEVNEKAAQEKMDAIEAERQRIADTSTPLEPDPIETPTPEPIEEAEPEDPPGPPTNPAVKKSVRPAAKEINIGRCLDMRASGKTMTEIAKVMGVSVSTISKRLKGIDRARTGHENDALNHG